MPRQESHTAPDLVDLVEIFYEKLADLATFSLIEPVDVPAPYDTLLCHEGHMTVTVERFHGSSVDVRVLAEETDGAYYARKILLTRQTDAEAVQFGVVRLNRDFLDKETWREIESQQIPLGRILVQRNVLRQVQLTALWRVAPGTELSRLLGSPTRSETYGRTALIFCNGEPAVELLEIVAPIGQ